MQPNNRELENAAPDSVPGSGLDPGSDPDSGSEHPPRVGLNRRTIVTSIVLVVVIVGVLYFVLPRLVGLGTEVKKLRDGNVWWLIGAALLEAMSYVGYVTLFRGVFVHGMPKAHRARIGWNTSYQVTMAGLAATRVFATAGAGGILLTVWALRRAGMEARTVATRMVAFNVILYAIYMSALVVCGLGLYLGAFSGEAPFAVTVVPAILGAVVILLALSVAALPHDFENLVARWARGTGGGRFARFARRFATVPQAAAQGVRTTLSLVRRGDPSLLGAVVWWGFDIATLWASFHAFGQTPPDAVIVMAYFVGWIANTLPIPGGIGGVEGGMIGAFAAFGVPAATAVLAVLAYRVFSYWLPTPPGVVAYFQLRGTVNRWRREELPAAVEPGLRADSGSAATQSLNS